MAFSDWIEFIFNHPVLELAWHRNIDLEEAWPELDASQIVAYLTQLFNDANAALQPFSDAQVNQGLYFLVSPSCSDYMFALKDEKVLLTERLRCINSMSALFERCFATRCSPHLAHLNEPGTNSINSVCFMWWDVLPIHGLIKHAPERSDSAAIDQVCLGVMQGILGSDAVACVESALHGLGEWSIYYPAIETILSDFLKRSPNIRPELRAYAERAAVGRV